MRVRAAGAEARATEGPLKCSGAGLRAPRPPAIDAARRAPHHLPHVASAAEFEREITPDILLRAYSIGLFPMAESREAETLFWVEPKARGFFPLRRPHRLAQSRQDDGAATRSRWSPTATLSS